MQQCCARACALVRFCNTQYVTTGWLNACNILCPTILPFVVAKCCNRLAGLANAVPTMLPCVVLKCYDCLAEAFCGDMPFYKHIHVLQVLTKDSHLFTILEQLHVHVNKFNLFYQLLF